MVFYIKKVKKKIVFVFLIKFFNFSDLVQPSWEQDNNTEQKTRTVCLTLSLSQAVGPKSSQVTENQVIKKSY